MDELEIRHLDGALRAETPDARAPRLVGYAILTDTLSADLGGFRERITPDAVARALEGAPDLVALRNHDTLHVLGRRSAGTLRVDQDARGLQFEVTLPTHEAGLAESVGRGDLPGASFAFRNATDTWDMATTPPTRTITGMQLTEISAGCPFPAYPSTHVARRSLERHQERHQPDKEPAMDPQPTSTVTDPVPPVPPVVTERAALDDAEVRILGREDSFRSWMEARTKHPKEYAALRLGDCLRAMITGPRSDLERRALAEGADATGGFTVPDIVLARFIDKLRAAIVCLRAGAQTVPLTSDVTSIARLAADPSAAWRAENAGVAESDPTFEAVTFTARSLDVQMKVSRELVEDSLNITDMLETALLRSFAVEVDRVCLHGTGTPPQPRGLRTTTNVGEVVMGAQGAAVTTYDKLIETLAKLWTANVMSPTALIMAPRTRATLATFKDSTGQPLAIPPVLSGIPWYLTTSMPITETQGNAVTASSVFIGDFTQMLLGFRTEMQIEVARELYRGNYQYGFFGHLRMDVQVTHPESFARLIGIIP